LGKRSTPAAASYLQSCGRRSVSPAPRAEAGGVLRVPRLAQVLQRLLQRLRRRLGKPGMLRLELRQPRAQRGVAWPLAARRDLGALIRQRLVENEAAAADPAAQHRFLLRLQAQGVLEALADPHRREVCLVGCCIFIQYIEPHGARQQALSLQPLA
jgi:hypothetical protein